MKTFSDQYPQIQRLQGQILFPYDIKEREIKEEDGPIRVEYEYQLLRVPDRGQQIDDYESFKLSNYLDLRRELYGDWREQLDMLFHGNWQDHIANVKKQFPKALK